MNYLEISDCPTQGLESEAQNKIKNRFPEHFFCVYFLKAFYHAYIVPIGAFGHLPILLSKLAVCTNTTPITVQFSRILLCFYLRKELAEAYYILSDSQKREAYDKTYTPGAPQSSSFPRPSAEKSASEKDRAANNIFGDVFESLLKPEVEKETTVWRNVGAVSGGALGFIMANLPGAVAGAFAGRSLGKIRDKKGKAVIHVFQELPYSDRIKILAAISAKLLLGQISN
ncbi:hypothetical protein BB561_002462 [Smittium simulii]|uniref:J domain-containing protein n=1 Tax=Smittium simulii TaxID=133385 RepID=A0A2T9YQD4_9FUNG|nr:hypothetical protein BB561_002462 [Smittium simulii]